MTDIVVVPASIVAASTATRVHGTAGETLLAGKAVYKDPTTRKWLLSDSNSATAAARRVDGIALTGSSLNQPVVVHTDGDLAMGAILTAGVAYYLSDTPGGICPVADVGTGEYVTLIGLAKSTSLLGVKIQSAGVAL